MNMQGAIASTVPLKPESSPRLIDGVTIFFHVFTYPAGDLFKDFICMGNVSIVELYMLINLIL